MPQSIHGLLIINHYQAHCYNYRALSVMLTPCMCCSTMCISLSMVVLNSRDCYEIQWGPLKTHVENDLHKTTNVKLTTHKSISTALTAPWQSSQIVLTRMMMYHLA